jgi:hypothetical protein
MIEAEWLTCTDPTPMLEFLRGKISERKVRLFSCACCRRIWHLLSELSREVVMLAERYADGLVGDEERLAARKLPSETGADAASRAAVARYAESMEATPLLASAEAGRAEEVEQARLLRDIFGNPFRPITLDLSFLTPTVVQLAQAIYDNRAFNRLPELADTLHDAGCDNEEILNHCRGQGPHVRGCWVVDLILGKK